MASYERVIKFENEKPNGVIRLVESNGFYRAYNHSAYLFHQVIAQHKVTRKFAKNINQEIVYVGFPADKLLERIGGRSHKKTDLGYDVELATDELPKDSDYEEWLSTVPKRTKGYQLRFEMNQERELVRLRDELMARRYAPRPSSCSIVHDPKMREVFAAEFRDRVVHHLFYNYTHEVFERSFVADSYSCIEGRGTHYGIERLKHHIRSCSQNWARPCFVLKLDVRGYFMHIRRDILVRTFLRERLKLDLSENKTRICDVRHGVEFLGAFIKPYRTYVSAKSMRRICKHIHSVSTRMDRARAQAVVNSSLGVLSHYDSHNMRRVLIERSSLLEVGCVSEDYLWFSPDVFAWGRFD